MVYKSVDYYDIESLLSDEEKMARNLAREFLAKEIKPLIVDAFDREEPLNMRELAPKMGKLGLIGAFIPDEFGTAGVNYVTFGLICQELERVDSSLRSFVGVQSALVMYPIWKFGSGEQKQKWLPLIARGEKIGAFGLTDQIGVQI